MPSCPKPGPQLTYTFIRPVPTVSVRRETSSTGSPSTRTSPLSPSPTTTRSMPRTRRPQWPTSTASRSSSARKSTPRVVTSSVCGRRSASNPGASAQDTVDAIHAQGGLAVVAHPFAPRWWAKHGLCRGDRGIYDCVDFDAFEISNSTPLIFHANWLARRYMRDHAHRFAVTGGSDAHILSAIGASRTLFPGTTAADLRRAIEAAHNARGPQGILAGAEPSLRGEHPRHPRARLRAADAQGLGARAAC